MPTFHTDTCRSRDAERRTSTRDDPTACEDSGVEANLSTLTSRQNVASWLWWVLAIPVAVCVVGLVGIRSKSSVPVFEWKEHAGVFQYHPEFVFRERREGTGETRFSPLGFSGRSDDPRPETPKIVIWGDSLVEALQVDDSAKLQNVLTERAMAVGGKRFFQDAVGLGFGGTHGLDWLTLAQRYSPQLGDVRAHFVLLHDLSDLDPKEETLFHLSPQQWRQSQVQRDWPWRPRLAKCEAGGLYYLIVQATSGQFGGDLRFTPGPVAVDVAAEEREFGAPDWTHRRWLLRQMSESLDAPLIVVWVPEAPRLVHGKIEFEDRRFPGQIERLRQMCDELMIRFVDMQPVFDEHCLAHRELPRGFPNTFLGEGHLNEVGHRLVADRIWKACEEIADVVR